MDYLIVVPWDGFASILTAIRAMAGKWVHLMSVVESADERWREVEVCVNVGDNWSRVAPKHSLGTWYRWSMWDSCIGQRYLHVLCLWSLLDECVRERLFCTSHPHITHSYTIATNTITHPSTLHEDSIHHGITLITCFFTQFHSLHSLVRWNCLSLTLSLSCTTRVLHSLRISFPPTGDIKFIIY
jgi:hypothetical protein